MSSDRKRKLAAIMFIDIVGYSRMMGLNEERTLKILKDFENIGSSLIKENDGSIIKKIGDELFCEFSSAKHAVDAALAIQNALQSYNDSRPKDFKLQVRIGIHLGDIVKKDGDVFGDGVNVASRISPFAVPGGICISNAVKDVVSSHPNYSIKSEGQQELKNILEKHTLFRVETGFEDKIKLRKRILKSSFLKYIGAVFFILILVSGYYGYKIYNNYNMLFNNTIDIGDEYIFLFDKIYSEEGLFIADYLKQTQTEFNHYNFKAISETTLLDIYNELLSSLSQRIPKEVEFINRNTLKKNFESKGELVPMYDLRFERNFVENMTKDVAETAQKHFDNSTNYIMVKSGANIASFVMLFEIINPEDDDKYFYVHLNRQLEHDGENFSNMNAGISIVATSESRLISDLTNTIIQSFPEIKLAFKGEIININENEILFSYAKKYSDLIEEDYILSAKRLYSNTNTFINDLIDYEKELIAANDTTSLWFKEFYQPKQIGWSKFELDLLESNNHYILKQDNERGAGITLGTTRTKHFLPKLKVVNVYDTTGLAIVYKVENPYTFLKIGDILIIE